MEIMEPLDSTRRLAHAHRQLVCAQCVADAAAAGLTLSSHEARAHVGFLVSFLRLVNEAVYI